MKGGARSASKGPRARLPVSAEAQAGGLRSSPAPPRHRLAALPFLHSSLFPLPPSPFAPRSRQRRLTGGEPSGRKYGLAAACRRWTGAMNSASPSADNKLCGGPRAAAQAARSAWSDAAGRVYHSSSLPKKPAPIV